MPSQVSACKKCVLHRPKNDGKWSSELQDKVETSIASISEKKTKKNKKKKQLPEKNGDGILNEFSTFLENVVKKSISSFQNFDPKNQELDKFFSQYFQDGEYFKLWEVMKMLLVLSHGQAAIERGFSVNKAIEVEDLKEKKNVYFS